MSVVNNVKKVSSSFLILSMLLLATAFYASTANAQTPTVAPTFDVATGSSVGSITPGLGSSFSSPDSRVTISHNSAAAKTAALLQYTAKAGADAPAEAPSGMTFSSVLFTLNQVDAAGTVATGAAFNSTIDISITYNDTDVAAAQGNPGRLVLYKYNDSSGTWHALATNLNAANKTISASVRSLSFFALVGQPVPPVPTPTPAATPTSVSVSTGHSSLTLAEALAGATVAAPTAAPTAAPPEPTATLLPPTPGDIAPGSGFVLGLVVMALVLISAGGYYMKEANKN
ncbi:hypothetical protein M1N14_00415 [Dehalococcoidia bacterium]|nr:hypothetical protein [Dehalococcoidia bacterium]